MPRLSLISKLAILQQGEYEWWQYEEWKRNNPDWVTDIKPKRWTSKLRLLSAIAKLIGPIIGDERALRIGLLLLAGPQAIVTSVWLLFTRLKLRYLQSRGLIVIAIAGSYAKTSTKHILAEVLKSQTPTLATPGNINRLLGFASLIWSKLDAGHKVFVVEMGEYNPGEIRRMRDYLSPSIVIITPITVAHLERFSSKEAIASEIFDAIGGVRTAIVHEANRDAYQELGLTQPVTWYGNSMISNAAVSRAGTEYDVQLEGTTAHVFIQLLGTHNAVNTVPAMLVGDVLGIAREKILTSLASVPIVPHRLEPTLLERGILLLDNGYNSNPASAKEALSVLSQIEGSQKIVSTPGFVELGEAQEQYNEALGEQISKVADLCVVIRSVNHDAIRRGLVRGGMREDQIISADGEEQGMNLLAGKLKPMAVVLFENSIPELYTKARKD